MDWLRLWHDMPNDPKWRTIARVSGRSISEVMAVYCHLLVMASSNQDRGHVDGIECHDMSRENVTNVTFVTCHEINFLEGLSTALDIEIQAVESILNAMQGRVLAGSKMSGWDGRQPKREDAGTNETGPKSAKQRKREQRERQRAQQENGCSHEESRTVTQSHDRLDTDTDIKEHTHNAQASDSPPALIEDQTARPRFAMTDDWEPDSRSFTAVLARNGMANQRFHADQLLEFRSYWISRPGDHKTQAQWEHALAQQLKRQSRIQQAAEGNSHETGGRTPGRSTRNAHDILTDPNW
ncbi:DnaT-like ssDNA-binding domain-containing protein [Pseudomonas monteilii]|uniref:DnaT-like ssDNA-binding domain-containing protein n=1 Tax=Pseudomonas TaxID=286 RepID=UPI0007615487|nr:DnaT-like ssDNA-binding domain-containing protein [Pseudomonas sp. NBRC 111136]